MSRPPSLKGNDNNEHTLRAGKCLTPFQRKLLQKSLQDDLSARYRQRIQIMLLADEGQTQAQICKTLECSQGTARHWIFMARSGQAHNWNDNPIGRPKTVNDKYLERLRELAHQSPREHGYVFQHWTAQWLSKHLAKEFGIEINKRHINRLLKEMGLSTRPKPTPDKETTPPPDTSNRLMIRDLSEACATESQILWPFNSIN